MSNGSSQKGELRNITMVADPKDSNAESKFWTQWNGFPGRDGLGRGLLGDI